MRTKKVNFYPGLKKNALPFTPEDIVCGVDEAGRGPLAGPVFAAAVILTRDRPIDGLRDSKKLTAERRDELAPLIKQHALAWAIAECSHEEIDAINILQATMLAMRRAVEALSTMPTIALIDGNRSPVMTDPLPPDHRRRRQGACDFGRVDPGQDRARRRAGARCTSSTRNTASTSTRATAPRCTWSACASTAPCPVHRRSFAPVRAALVGEIARAKRIPFDFAVEED